MRATRGNFFAVDDGFIITLILPIVNSRYEIRIVYGATDGEITCMVKPIIVS